jgi:hypothetical protein
MGLNRAQRRKKNRANARHSTGPTSQEGKRIASLNSLRNGLTAKTLVLPNENPQDVQAKVDAWHQSCQPQGHLEEELVNQMALASQRIQRIARAESAILAEQVANAEIDWKHAQETRLLRLTRRLYAEPEQTHVDLLSFGAGVCWLLERWVNLHEAFERYGCWNHPHLIDHALRLDGANPDYFHSSTANATGYELAVVAISCIPNFQEVPILVDMLRKMPADWVGRHGVDTTYERAEAQRKLLAHIEMRIRELTKLAEDFQIRDERALILASERAQALRDTPENRLLVRYMKSAETSFDKAYRALQKAQWERQNAAESASEPGAEEGSKAVLPNEPEVVGRTHSKRIHVGSCIKLNGVKYEVVETSDGNLLLCPWVDVVAKSGSEVVPTPETVV